MESTKPCFMTVEAFCKKLGYTSFEVVTNAKTGSMSVLATDEDDESSWHFVSPELKNDPSLLEGHLCVLIPYKEGSTTKVDYTKACLIVGKEAASPLTVNKKLL